MTLTEQQEQFKELMDWSNEDIQMLGNMLAIIKGLRKETPRMDKIQKALERMKLTSLSDLVRKEKKFNVLKTNK